MRDLTQEEMIMVMEQNPPEKAITRDIIYISKDEFYVLYDNPKDEKNKTWSESNLLEKGKKILSVPLNVLNTCFDVLDNITSPVDVVIEKVFDLFSPTKKESDLIQIIPRNLAEWCFNYDKIKVKDLSSFLEGTILAKHPFLPNTYVSIDAMEKEILFNKLICLSSIVQFLGAKSISGHAVIKSEQKRQRDSSGNIKLKNVKMSVQAKTDEAQKYETTYRLEDSFSGDFSLESYSKALNLAKEFGLNQNFYIQQLLSKRNPENSMHINSSKLSIEVSQELNNALDTAFSASAFVWGSLDAKYKEVLENRKTIFFEVDIRF